MTTTYDYRAELKLDIIGYVQQNVDIASYGSYDELTEALYDDLWTEDSVTGNGSGSYTFSTWQAEENLSHNWELLIEAAEAFGIEPTVSDGYDHGAEWWDVTIRCYLLGEMIGEALGGMGIDEDSFSPDHVTEFQLHGFMTSDDLEEAERWNENGNLPFEG